MNKGPTQKDLPANMPNFWEEETLNGTSAPDIAVNAFSTEQIWGAFRPKGTLENQHGV